MPDKLSNRQNSHRFLFGNRCKLEYLPPVQKKATLDDYVKQLYLLSKKLHLSSFSLIGHSMGAMIAVAFALKYPNEISL